MEEKKIRKDRRTEREKGTPFYSLFLSSTSSSHSHSLSLTLLSPPP